jgi:malonyl-CoA/methylmalonyl-CoA synthetase
LRYEFSDEELMTENLFAVFRARFPADPRTPFLILPDGRTVTYADMEAGTARIANLLVSLGVKTGDRVAMQVEKSPEAVFLYLACLRAGAVFLPLNTAYRADELDYFLEDAEPTVVICDPGATALIALCAARKIAHQLTLSADGTGTLMERSAESPATFATVTRAASDLAVILYSSGTTGKPKGVMLTHGALASNASTLHALWKFVPGDVLLHTLPIFHIHGLFVALNTTLMNGSAILFHPKFTAEDTLRDLPRATVFMGVPTYYGRLAAHPGMTPDAAKSVRIFLCGSAPLLEETFAAFKRASGKEIVERYGMTEAGMITSADPARGRHAGLVGWPLPGVSLRLTGSDNTEVVRGETGEIQIKSPGLFAGYWKKPEKTAEDFTADGFFKTGDLATIAADGSVSIVGRAKDMMISGGFNVYPKEIEMVIDALPGVLESAVVGMPHPDFGEAGLAVITMNAGVQPLEANAVRASLKDALANYKVPKMIVIADALPRNAMGKVQKNLLRSTYRAQWDAELKASS